VITCQAKERTRKLVKVDAVNVPDRTSRKGVNDFEFSALAGPVDPNSAPLVVGKIFTEKKISGSVSGAGRT
jgi:hypothetical protein